MKKLLLTLFLITFTLTAKSQITVTHFNAEWNDPNKAEWVGKLTDC